jgi:hypothetical protein
LRRFGFFLPHIFTPAAMGGRKIRWFVSRLLANADLRRCAARIPRCRQPFEGATHVEGGHQRRWLHVKIREGILSSVGSPAHDQRTMRYEPDWIPLAEARRRLESCGHSKDEAEQDICMAIADKKIKIRYKILQVFGSGGLALPPPLLGIPGRLGPQDFDWEKSVTVTPWQERIHRVETRVRPSRYPRQAIISIELSRASVVRVLCGGRPSSQTPNELSGLERAKPPAQQEILASATETSRLDPVAVHPSTRSKSSAKRQRASRALKEAFPDGVPDKDHMTDVEVCRAAQKVLGKAAENLSDETILRAAGRRK